MKKHRLKKIPGLCFLLISLSIKAQTPFIPNGGFESNCDSNAPCVTFSATCIPSWFVSHGSPQIVDAPSAGFEGEAYIRMWTQESFGEGIGVNLSEPLTPGEQYRLCFAYRTFNELGITPVNIHVQLANGLSHNPACGTGDLVPSGSMQEIAQIPFPPGNTPSNWIYTSFPFIPNLNYQQIIIYPLTAVDAHDTVPSLHVDAFSLTPRFAACTATLGIDYISPPVPAAIYDQKKFIRAGSHINGSTTLGLVTVNQPGLTKFAASDYISMEDNFIAYPERGYFLAMIEPCELPCPPPVTGGGAQARMAYSESNHPVSGVIEVFPNPASNQVTVKSLSGLLYATLTDISGRVLRKFDPSSEETSFVLSVEDLQTGIYILNITDRTGKTEVKKIAIEN